MTDEKAASNRKLVFGLFAVIPVIVVIGLLAGRDLPLEMDAAQAAAQQYVDGLRSEEPTGAPGLRSSNYVAPSDDEIAMLRSMSFIALDTIALGQHNKKACVGGGIGEGRMTSDSIRVYLVFEDGAWKVETAQVFDNFEAPEPPWPQGWGGGKLQGSSTCALGY